MSKRISRMKTGSVMAGIIRLASFRRPAEEWLLTSIISKNTTPKTSNISLQSALKHITTTSELDLAESICKLICELESTFDSPSNWQNIPEELAEEFNGNDWVMENFKLYEYV